MAQQEFQLPEGWKWATLGQIADAQSGAGFPKSYQGLPSGDYPFAKVSDISEATKTNGGIIDKANNYLSATTAKKIGAKVFPVGTTLFAKIGEAVRLNRRAMNKCPILADNNVMGLIPDLEKIMPRYIFHFMHSVDLYEYSQATTVPSVRKSDIEQIPIPLPPLPEQERIVAKIEALFSQLDAGVATLLRIQAGLKRYKASVLKAACEGRLVPQDPADEPAGELLRRLGKSPLEDEDLLALPEGWCWATVGNLAKKIQYGYTESASDESIGPKFLRITDIQDGRVNWETVPYCKIDDKDLTKYLLRLGDIVFARTGATTGKSYLIRECPTAVFASYLIRLRLQNDFDVNYFALFLDSPMYWAQIMTVRKGSAQPGVNAAILSTLKVPLPPLPEQERIVAEVERCLSVIAEVDAEVAGLLARSGRLRGAILKQAFEGKLV